MIGYLKAGLFCTNLALFLNVIPAAIPYWWRFEGEINHDQLVNSTDAPESSSVLLTYGGITWCSKYDVGAKQCFSYEDPPAWLTASFSMLIVAIGFLVFSAACSVLFINIYTGKKALGVVAAGLSFLGAIADVVSLILFGINASNYFIHGSFYAAFGVPVVAIVFAVMGGYLLFRYRNAEHKIPDQYM